ncbi:T9SS type A sorting domain-containing protein [Cytophaga hutchinsonii]|uniref:Secretion system C-terminal sorting domain-containing protein n=1 Tax=Cytophaga hutchinsonii (strain ATCC 33406 / DSM 1761 / CIP 103989 / NBRC 15051 / NCIMB 9469 / D465) TaxID=269798 RepID=A0A6N4SVE7_CYTH3|nr:T9SS type A sorting domain-containing protein [Cytophaga hutchinsonii]ABG60506.1 hypothetical protein CHU_3267 [Cytophaga hutchinsonii ATCC 33406]SFX84520.1 Por secretion system C-terminal sorting domain-containing protein [Cytophaga hutchinsonii ATCC 33406]
MKTISLTIYIILSAFLSFGQIPYAYNDEIITDGKPVKVKEYNYDYDSQEEQYIKNHTFTYNSDGKLTEHIETGKDITEMYQTFRYRFQYDTEGRLSYYWNEQETLSGYKSQYEQQWLYDSHGMITDVNIWSVVNDTKYLIPNSYKRLISRDGEDKVLKIEKYIYGVVIKDGEYEEKYILETISTFKYTDINTLDSIIVYRSTDLTNGGTMALDSKRYNFDFRNYNVLNTDLITYDSYETSNYNDEKTKLLNTYDLEGRLTSQKITNLNDIIISKTAWIYELDKVTATGMYEKKIDYIDASGRNRKTETYSFNGTDWELLYPANMQNIRMFQDGKIVSDLLENYYDSETGMYKNDTRFDYEYSLTAGILNQKASDVILLYPNPSTGIVYLKDYQKIQKLSVSSISGTPVIVPVQEQVDLSGFSAGIYIVTAEYADKRLSIQRLILK